MESASQWARSVGDQVSENACYHRWPEIITGEYAGIAFYTIFGFMAGYSGYLIWRVFLGIDSYEFPARNYGDLGFRTWGTTARYVTNICQALGLLLLLGQVTIQFGQNISQVSKFKLWSVLPLSRDSLLSQEIPRCVYSLKCLESR
jgi:hypothetical protein